MSRSKWYHPPKDAQIGLDGSYYKVKNGVPYRWNDCEWVKSSKDFDEIQGAIDKNGGKPIFIDGDM